MSSIIAMIEDAGPLVDFRSFIYGNIYFSQKTEQRTNRTLTGWLLIHAESFESRAITINNVKYTSYRIYIFPCNAYIFSFSFQIVQDLLLVEAVRRTIMHWR